MIYCEFKLLILLFASEINLLRFSSSLVAQ